jgi:hypothetical protein
LIGAVIVPLVYRPFIVGTTAFAGASVAVAGGAMLLPGAGVFDHASGSFLPTLLVLLLGLLGIGWQIKNISKWAHLYPSPYPGHDRQGNEIGAKETSPR